MINILVADDEEIIRNNFVKRINRTSASFNKIFKAKNGIEAVKIFDENSIHVALVDINMPFLNGLELIKKIHSISPNTIIVIVSGYDNFSYAQEAIKYGVYRYILKPVVSEEFNKVIETSALLARKNLGESDTIKPTLEKITSNINQNYQNSEYSLTSLSKQIGLSEGHISKILKKEIGMTFSDFLTDLRIEKAKKIILSEGCSVKMYEVAEAVGYKNQYYFSMVFKKIAGVPPKKFAQSADNIF